MNPVNSTISVLNSTDGQTNVMIRKKVRDQTLSDANSPLKSAQRLMSRLHTLGLNFDNDNKKGKLYPQSLQLNFSKLSRILMINVYKYCSFIRQHVYFNLRDLRYSDLPKLGVTDRLELVIEHGCQYLRLFEQREAVWTDFAKLIFVMKLFPIVALATFAFLMDSVAKSTVSILLSRLISNISVNDMDQAYINISIIIALNLVSLFGKNYGYLYGMLYSVKVRILLINLLYYKLTKLNSFSIKEAEFGNIISLVSGDLAQVERGLSTVCQVFVVPVTLVYGSAILWSRFNGLFGLLIIGFMLTAYPVVIFIGVFFQQFYNKQKPLNDSRIRSINEFLDGIKNIKFQALEALLSQRIRKYRKAEKIATILYQVGLALQRSISYTVHIWVSVIFFIFVIYGNMDVTITVADFIATIQLLSYMKQSTVNIFSLALNTYLMLRTSFIRFAQIINIKNHIMFQITNKETERAINFTESSTEENALNSPTNQQNRINLFSNLSPINTVKQIQLTSIHLQNFNSYWCNKDQMNDKQPTLKSINLQIQSGEFWIVYGNIGSGKSSLLLSIIGEIPLYSGYIKVQEDLNIALVEQQPFLFPDTIRNNIIFGRPYDPALYEQVLFVTSIWRDILDFQSKDLTEVKENGSNLSGGQKSRISLARALYSLADIYLLDDPMSAVDATVSKTIFKEAITRFIRDIQPKFTQDRPEPIIILVTNQQQYVNECDKLCIMERGEIIQQGKFEDVDYFNDCQEQFEEQEESDEESPSISGSQSSIQEESDDAFYKIDKLSEEKKLIINFKTLKRYLSFWNIFMAFIVIAVNIGFVVVYQVWISIITKFDVNSQSSDTFNLICILAFCCVILNIVKLTLATLGHHGATYAMHENMIDTVSRLSMEYFDSHPSGRTICRFSEDMNILEYQGTFVIWDILEIIITFLVTLCTIGILQPYFFIVVLVLVVINFKFLFYYKELVIQTKEIELQLRNPVFSFLKLTMGGIIQIKMYKQYDWFRKKFQKITNKLYKCSIIFYRIAKAFEFNIDLSCFITQTIGLIMIIQLNQSDFSSFSQSVFLLITFTDQIQWGFRQLITFQTQMNNYQRIFNLIDEEVEAPHFIKNPPKNFPKDGTIEFQDVNVRYREDLPLVLKSLNFKVAQGERIACVGRSGAGKSTILQALFRIVEIDFNEGQFIKIGGVDIRTLGLHQLRSSIGIIPQSPFLISGTLRENLDPENEHTNEELYQVIEDCYLSDIVENLKDGLNSRLDDQQSISLSMGQKQLICLGRLILQNKKLVVLDEATANLDEDTDELIQDVLRLRFQNSTILTVAHKLVTIADYDRVIVMKKGEIAEIDNPYKLLAKSKLSEEIDNNSRFAEMVKQTGTLNSRNIFYIAKQKYLQTIKE